MACFCRCFEARRPARACLQTVFVLFSRLTASFRCLLLRVALVVGVMRGRGACVHGVGGRDFCVA